MKITRYMTLEEFKDLYAYILVFDIDNPRFTDSEMEAIYNELSTMTEYYEMGMSEDDVHDWLNSDVLKIHIDDVLEKYPIILDRLKMTNPKDEYTHDDIIEALEYFTKVYNYEDEFVVYQNNL
mgnify:FL=1